MMKPRMEFDMKNSGIAVALGLIVFCSSSIAQAEMQVRGAYVPSSVIVKLKRLAPGQKSGLRRFFRQIGVRRVSYLSSNLRLRELKLRNNIAVEATMKILNHSPFVEYAHPNYVLSLPNRVTRNGGRTRANVPCLPGMDVPGCDPNECWVPGLPLPPGCRDSGGGGGGGNPPANDPPLADRPDDVNPPQADPELNRLWGMEKIDATTAWQTTSDASNVVVAVIDTGIDYNHPDLRFNIWNNPNPTRGDTVGYDFSHDDAMPFDDHFHGTHVSGTVGGVGGNGVGVAGVSHKVQLMGIKFLTSEGSGTLDGAIKSIEYAANNGANIINASWGGPASGDQARALKDAIDALEQKGVLFVAAAGNGNRAGIGQDNDDPSKASFPAAFDSPTILAVAASDRSDNLTRFSNYGRTSTDLAAPGTEIYSTAPGNTYRELQGTSMASPMVAGAAALVWANQTNPTWRSVKDALINSVDKVSALSGKLVSEGRMNLDKALRQ